LGLSEDDGVANFGVVSVFSPGAFGGLEELEEALLATLCVEVLELEELVDSLDPQPAASVSVAQASRTAQRCLFTDLPFGTWQWAERLTPRGRLSPLDFA
jgi:hypothetical protein